MIRGGIDEYIRGQRAVGRKSVKDHVSVLKGATHRVVGKKAAGTALGNTSFGLLRCDRVELPELVEWFFERHEGLAAATRKRGMSSLRGFVKYCIGQGYMDERVLAGLMDVAGLRLPGRQGLALPRTPRCSQQPGRSHRPVRRLRTVRMEHPPRPRHPLRRNVQPAAPVTRRPQESRHRARQRRRRRQDTRDPRRRRADRSLAGTHPPLPDRAERLDAFCAAAAPAAAPSAPPKS